MRQFLIKVVLFALFFFAADHVSYFIIVHSEDEVHDQRLKLVLDGQINKDILVIGSSRGAKGIIAQQIEDATGYSTYNLCYRASDLTFHEFMVRTVLKFNQAPKLILLTMDDPQELWDHENFSFPSPDLYPHIHYRHINETLIDLGEHSIVSRFFWTSRIKDQHLNPTYQDIDPFDTVRTDGSQTIRHYKSREFEFYLYNYDKENEMAGKIKLVKDIEKRCLDHGVKLAFVYPPNFKVHNPEFVDRMQTIASPEVLHCVYDYQDTLYRNKDLFYDADHLHISGARIFTDEVIDFIGKVDL